MRVNFYAKDMSKLFSEPARLNALRHEKWVHQPDNGCRPTAPNYDDRLESLALKESMSNCLYSNHRPLTIIRWYQPTRYGDGTP
jgi:hypothetical protein